MRPSIVTYVAAEYPLNADEDYFGVILDENIGFDLDALLLPGDNPAIFRTQRQWLDNKGNIFLENERKYKVASQKDTSFEDTVQKGFLE